MSINSFGHLFRVTTWGESHGPAIGATVDGCPPGVPVDEAMIQARTNIRPNDAKQTRCKFCLVCSKAKQLARRCNC